jgi:hypothetical protein
MKYIELTQGQRARVSDEDYDTLSKHKWNAHWNKHAQVYYAERHSRRADGKQQSILMHRVIVGAQLGQQVDHIDHDGLHNERENIRVCTVVQNAGNARKRRDGLTSHYKGVHWSVRGEKWVAAIKVAGVSKYLGSFVDETKAATAYDNAAREQWGEFALTNRG